jgi:hypothetical protein
MTDGWTVEAKQLKNRRVAETKWGSRLACKSGHWRNTIRVSSKLGEQQANVIE